MEKTEKKKIKEMTGRKSESAVGSKCESCEFYTDDEEFGPTCSVGLDEDEFALFIGRTTGNCPYYRFYDEYATVRRQN